jgi:serine O-acetyltransferase
MTQEHPRIHSYRDYRDFRQADGTWGLSWLTLYLDDVLRFLVLLRRAEYWTNCSTSSAGRLVALVLRCRLRKAGARLGFTIPANVFGPGLSIPHPGTIVVNDRARVGRACRLHVGVVIGASGGIPGAPEIGDRVYLGPGAKVFGAIRIADDVAVGANAVVNASVVEAGVTVAGVPARVISRKGSAGAGWNP